MERSDIVYQTYLKILKRELISAMGCTEPVALAYCAAVARATLGSLPDRIIVEASGNIIKNVKSVVVPNTGGQRGIPAAVCIGVLAGDEKAGLQVLSRVTEEDKERLVSYMKETPVVVKPLISENLLDMIVTVHGGASSASVRIANEHTNIIRIEKDDKVLQENKSRQEAETDGPSDDDLLKVDKIWDFACTCAIEDVKELLDRQIAQNTAIAEEGMRRDYGANIGKVLLKAGNDVRTRARAYAAAGSDARMNGSELPVVICSGSGNQGLTKLYRALLISTLITIHLKSGIGRLSAYCGAVSAGAGAGCGVAYLMGGDENDIAHTIVNCLAITSGIVCDGAKSSCAAKIATAVETGIFGYEMYRNGQQFYAGDGLVVKGVENSIDNFGRLARIGMRGTDEEIIRLMTEET